MQFLIIVFISIFSGVFAGMGMGGGTFLIPLLYLFFDKPQIILQSTNVVSFLLVSLICFFIYLKGKLIDFKIFPFVAIPAMFLSFLGALFCTKISSRILHILFAIFVILIGIISLLKSIKNIHQNKS